MNRTMSLQSRNPGCPAPGPAFRAVGAVAWLLLLSLAFSSSPSPVAAQVIPRKGLTDFQVLQRGQDHKAAAAVTGTTTWKGRGVVEARVGKHGGVGDVVAWHACGQTDQGAFEAHVKGIPQGGPYEVQLRVRDPGSRIVDQGAIREVLVGDLWILGGQSNMEGCGILKRGAVPPHRLVHAFDMADRWLVAEEPLHWKHESPDPVHSGSPGEERDRRRLQARKHRWRGSGLGLPFARAMVERTGVPVGLIPCAQGGSCMEQWDPAGKARGGHSLYGSMMRRFREVGGRVRGMLWYQGESDASPERVDAFKDRFLAFVAAVRSDTGQPHLPFYYVQLGRYLFLENQPQWTAIRNDQLRSETEIPAPVGMVAAIDQPLVDAIHVRTCGLDVVGRRLAFLAARDLLGLENAHRGPRPVKIEAAGGYPQRVTITYQGVNGRLRAPGRLTGFSIRDSQGQDLRMVFDQFIHPDHPDRVVLECQVTWKYAKFPEDAHVYYGWGNDPVCNLVDEAGLAAPAFGPWKLPPVKR